MNRTLQFRMYRLFVVSALFALMAPLAAYARVEGITGTPTGPASRRFDLAAKPGYVNVPDGEIIFFWGFAPGAGPAQYPGPTLIVNEGETVTVRLTNQLPEPVSLVFPGLDGPTAPVYDGAGKLRSLTQETAPAGPVVSYTFTAPQPGTYYYQSGTNLHKQPSMGMFGTIVVRSATANQAYDDASAVYDREYLLLLSEFDTRLNDAVEFGLPFDTTAWRANYWFINGRSAMDTFSPAGTPSLPDQPYSALVRMHPGERTLLRLLDMGRDPHPFHTHANHAQLIARDGRLLESAVGMGNDLDTLHFTMDASAGQVWDSIFTWSGDQLGWDIFGHASPSSPLEPGEFAADHGKPFPVALSTFESLFYGELYSGSQFLGQSGPLPPTHPGLNTTSALYFMWHSHREMEMTNANDFPGGMMTMLVIEAPGVPIP